MGSRARGWSRLAAIATVVTGLASTAASAAPLPAGAITEFPTGASGGNTPYAIAAGPDGNLWFTRWTSSTSPGGVGRITPSGSFTDFSAALSGSTNTWDIATGADGNLWFTETVGGAPEIGRITPFGTVTHFSNGITKTGVKNGQTTPVEIDGITAGPDGNVWFTESGGVDQIGRITASGTVTEFPVTANSSPYRITTGSDGNLWFTEDRADIGRITPSGTLTEFPITGRGLYGPRPFGITAGPDGALWYANNGGGIGRITTSGVQTEFTSGISGGSLVDIATGADGNLWYTDRYTSVIGRITPSGAVTEYSTGLTPGANAEEIVAGPDGNMWVAEGGPDSIARIGTGATIAARAAANASSAQAGAAVSFDASGSQDPNPQAGTIGYTWSFDDGGTATGAAVSHVFTTAGSHTATVTVTDSQGVTGTATATIDISAPPPTEGPPPLIARFSAATVSNGGSWRGFALSVIRDMSSVHVFDAGASVGATGYDWAIGAGNEATVASCPGTDPAVGVSGVGAGSQPIKLFVRDALGSVASLAGTFVSATPARVNAVTTCARTASAITSGVRTAEQLGTAFKDGSECSDRVDFATVEAQGCTVRVTSQDAVPAPERSILNFEAGGFLDAVCGFAPTTCAGLRNVGVVTGASLQSWDMRVAEATLMINGLEIQPGRGAHIVLAPELGRVVCSRATVRLGGVPVYVGPLDLNVNDPNDRPNVANLNKAHAFRAGLFRARRGGARAEIFTFDPSKLPSLGGFHLNGHATATFVRDPVGGSTDCTTDPYDKACGRYHTDFDAFLQLPKGSSVFGDDPPSGAVFFSANNDEGVNFDHLKISVPYADLGAARLQKLQFEYIRKGDSAPWWDNNWDRGPCARKWWKATAEVYVGPTYFEAAPAPPEYGLAFCDGSFANGGFRIGTEIFPSVVVDGGFSLRLNPTVITGEANLTVADAVRITADVLVAYGSPGHPYVMDSHAPDAFSPIKDELGSDAPQFDSTTIAVGGTVSMNIPVVGWTRLGGGYVLYQDPDYAMFGGWADFTTDGVHLSGHFAAEMNSTTHDYYGHGEVRADLPDPLPGFGATGAVSNRGYVFCGRVGDWNPGIGQRWGDHIQVWADSWAGKVFPADWVHGSACQPDYVYVNVPRARLDRAKATMAAAGDFTFTVTPGEHVKAIELTGAADAPALTVTDPAGETASTDQTTPGVHLMVMRWPAQKRTWIFVHDARPGAYTVTLKPGSAPIAGLRTSREISTSPVKGTVRRVRGQYVLHYTAGSLTGRQVVFFERGLGVIRRIGAARVSHGSVTFRPAVTQAEDRHVVAMVTVGDLPPIEERVAIFRYAGPPRLMTPRVTVSRHGQSVAATWTSVAGATGYQVNLELRSGEVRILHLGSRTRSAHFGSVALTSGGSVLVRALGVRHTVGKAGAASFRSLESPPTRFLAFSELRVHRWKYPARGRRHRR